MFEHRTEPLFASVYALFSGVVFIAVAGLLLAPLFHRVLHHFHLELAQAVSDYNQAEERDEHEDHFHCRSN